MYILSLPPPSQVVLIFPNPIKHTYVYRISPPKLSLFFQIENKLCMLLGKLFFSINVTTWSPIQILNRDLIKYS